LSTDGVIWCHIVTTSSFGRYLIVYRRQQDGIQVVRILSGHRDVAALLD